MSEHIVIVGNGMASLRLVEELLKRAMPNALRITVIGEEAEPAYNRVLLSSRLAGEVEADGISLRSHGWYAARGVTLITGTKVTAIDRTISAVALSSGESIGYDRLVLATGSDPVRLPLPGADIDRVVTFRDTKDVERMEALPAGSRTIVIGGGLLGIEAAWGLKRRGMKVTLIHVLDRLMERQLDVNGARQLEKAILGNDIEVILQATSKRVESVGEASILHLNQNMKSGETNLQLPFDLLVMAVGIRPRTELARAAGLDVNRGIIVSPTLATSDPLIFAIGECSESAGVVPGLVEPAYQQAEALSRTLCGDPATYEPKPVATNLKVSGVPVFSCGRFETEAGDEVICLTDPDLGIYRKLLVSDGRLAGCVLVGDTADGLFYLDLLTSARALDRFRADLAFGRAWCEAA
jgi:nitrite reductase (NADH) large subunit